MTQATVEIRAEGTDRVSATSRTEPAIDDRTVERLRGGDRAAFDALYRAYAGRIHAFSLRLCGAGAGGSRPGDRTAAAEEIVQEVFVRVWQHRRKIAGRLHLERWLHRVAINLRRNAQRTEARRGGPDATLTAEPEDRGGTPGPRTSALRSDLEQAVRALPTARARCCSCTTSTATGTPRSRIGWAAPSGPRRRSSTAPASG